MYKNEEEGLPWLKICMYVKWGGEAGRRGGPGCRADGAASAADCSRVISADRRSRVISADRRARRSGGETLRLTKAQELMICKRPTG